MMNYETEIYKNINSMNCLLMCSICNQVPTNPVRCNSECIFVLCKKCAIRQNSQQINCYKCKQPHNSIKLDKVAQYYYSKIGIQCNLCKQTFNSLLYQKHHDKCRQNKSEQSFKLQQTAFLKNIINSVNDSNSQYLIKFFQQSEEDIQNIKLVFCSLCKLQLPIYDISNHFNSCPNLILQCEYKCSWAGKRNQYIDHFKGCILIQQQQEILENECIDLQKHLIKVQYTQVQTENQILFEKFISDREVIDHHKDEKLYQYQKKMLKFLKFDADNIPSALKCEICADLVHEPIQSISENTLECLRCRFNLNPENNMNHLLYDITFQQIKTKCKCGKKKKYWNLRHHLGKCEIKNRSKLNLEAHYQILGNIDIECSQCMQITDKLSFTYCCKLIICTKCSNLQNKHKQCFKQQLIKCKNKYCQFEGSLEGLSHYQNCEFRSKKCRRCLFIWRGISRDYKNHKRLCYDSNDNNHGRYINNQIVMVSLVRQNMQVQRLKNLKMKRLNFLKEKIQYLYQD